jgi:DNA-binding NarL/FixJ family response regulator
MPSSPRLQACAKGSLAPGSLHLLHFRYRKVNRVCYNTSTEMGPGSGGAGETVMIMTLSSREREVATLVAKGLSNKQIAQHLNLEEGTVKIHLHNIFTKLAVKNRTVLAVMTLRATEPGCSEDRRGRAALAEAVAAA